MSKVPEKRRLLQEQLNGLVAYLLYICKTMPNPEIMVYELWTAKDVLSHFGTVQLFSFHRERVQEIILLRNIGRLGLIISASI